MRTAGVLVATSLLTLAAAAPARAERQTVTWVGLSFAGTSYANTSDQDAHMNGGARIALTFEDAPIATPGPGLFDHDARVVPELFAGFYANDVRARGQVGAGVRLELQFARTHSGDVPWHMRGAIYVAPRLKITGPNRDGGAELVIGEYLIGDRANRRFGWEGGLGLIKRPELDAARSPELEALVNVFVGF